MNAPLVQYLVSLLLTGLILCSDAQLEERHVALQAGGSSFVLTIALVWLFAFLLYFNYEDVFHGWKQRLFSRRNDASVTPKAPVHLLLLLAFVSLVLLSHIVDSGNSWQGLRVRTLLGGMAFGQLALLVYKTSSAKNPFLSRFILILSIALAGAIFGHYTNPTAFAYRGETRWTGFWQNPNTFGLLMGVGLLLALGQLLQAHAQKSIGWKWRMLGAGVIGLATGWGLLRSFSRGAWVGLGAGLIYFIFQSRAGWSVYFSRSFPWLRRHRYSLGLIILSLLALGWWGSRSIEWTPIRRVVSVGNPNDFSWRNRVDAWVGGLQMMTAKPWLGYGAWEADSGYAQFYRHGFYGERDPAILFNDYLVFGLVFGALGLIIFLAFLSAYFAAPVLSRRSVLQLSCRACVVTMLAGFFFDGGLFKIAPAVAFWTLLELGRMKTVAKPFDSAA
jgi:O-antigen ligase